MDKSDVQGLNLRFYVYNAMSLAIDTYVEGWQQYAEAHQHDAVSEMQHWQPPSQGYFKCNVDASFYNNAGATGWGWCSRDRRGRFIIAGSNVMHGRLNTIEGEGREAMAMKEAISE
ncbi:putative protein phosphatase 2C 42-like protein [Trifolium pratense]|uniref:Cytochrome p450 n=1 Tax=Trifolium pratense TaxID=57577 RepID=A0A2K3NLU0_TRIPR|nr:putative protein phosphatase 2C 42-like protein [Trifolium pratense]